jgi:cardiolipin synthase
VHSIGLGLIWSDIHPLVHLILVDVLIRAILVIFVLIRKSRNPQAALIWVILLMGLPIFGMVLYLLFGESRLGYWRRKRHAQAVNVVDRPEIRANANPETHVTLPRRESQIAALTEHVSDANAVTGNRVEIFGDSEKFVDHLVADIDQAKKSVHLLYFVYLVDNSGKRVAEALIRAANRGICCRLLVDSAGSKHFLKSSLIKDLKKNGVMTAGCLPVNPVRLLLSRLDLRNHRKIAVIDGQIGYTGSNNLADAAFAIKAKFAPWYDCTVRIDGPATKELQILFLTDWFMETSEFVEDELNYHPKVNTNGLPIQIIATGPNFYSEATTQIVQACIQIVHEEIILTTPYFVPDETTITNLCVASRRGVDVTLVVPKRNDSRLVAAASRSNYAPLLEAGVKILEFKKGLLHAKTISIDKDIGIVMSANLDRRSYHLNFECGAIVYDSDFASELRFIQQHYIDNSDRVDPTAWFARGTFVRVRDTATGLLSPIL